MTSRVNWLTDPPEIRLNVRPREPITLIQVALLEGFVQAEMGQWFTLIFVVGDICSGTAGGNSARGQAA
ncbi:hypothetical protein [Leptodesmis sp.]|uniref:hypothetical protein n=1 Tax=Leptodesmis sp. TaxID=3100501 RepID=UPI004053513D